MEGLVDSVFMYQYLHEKAQREQKSIMAKVNETILTPSNGVQTVPQLILENKLWEKFDEILFIMDEDIAGRKVTNELKEISKVADDRGNNFKFFNGLKEGEDFEDFYNRLMRGEK